MNQLFKIKEYREETWALILLVISGIYLFIISFISEGLYGDTDSIAHYNIARYAFKYPYQLVNHWGKPLFTILSAPFAQFGLQGTIFFNILCSLATAWLIYLIAKKLNYRYALAAIPFSLFAPIYMIHIFTSLTEILFALVLVAAIYFFLRQKNILSAIIISFIPYARTEGVMFLVIFMVAFLLVKKYKVIPFLLTGFIVYSIAGYFHYKNLFWFFTAMPYSDKGSELYGSGSFWHYFVRFPELMGIPLIILAVMGLIVLVSRLFKDQKPSLSPEWITQYYLIAGSFFTFLLVHSFIWWQGMMAVLASHRFMACIMPLGGFFAVIGLNMLMTLLDKRTWINRPLILAIVGIILWMPYYYHKIPAVLAKQNQVMKATADALVKLNYKEKKLIYFDPKITFFLHEDPFDQSKFFFRLQDSRKPEQFMADSSIMVWDTQFGEYQKKIFLEDLLRNPHFRLIDGFVPDRDFRFSTGQNYMSLIFQKVPVEKYQYEWITLDSMDFETAETEERISHLTDTIAFTGNKSIRLNPDWIYSFTLGRRIDSISTAKKVILRARAKVYIPGGARPDQIILVLSVHQASGDIFRYITKAGSYFNPEPREWFEISTVTPLQTDIPEDGTVKLYAWYQGKEEIFVDDLILEYIPVNE